jgi:predicted AlkP superfamily phosphohydrolase/phosphomutase
MAQGDMPNLAQIAAAGTVVPLETDAHVLEDSSWASFATGTGPGDHGHYSTIALRSGSYRLSRNEGYPHVPPFWDVLTRGNVSATIFDLPRFAPEAGSRVAFWTNPSDRRADEADPILTRRILRTAGRYPRLGGLWTRRSDRAEERLLAHLEWALGRRVAATRLLMREAPAELFLTAFPEAHYAGHAFHPHADPRAIGHDPGRVTPRLERLRRLHRALDRALGQILEAVSPATDILVFSLHGMAERYDMSGVLPGLLRQLGFARRRAVDRAPSAWSAARATLPRSLRGWLSSALSRTTQDRILAGLLEGSHDWPATRAFGVDPSRANEPWIRLNVRGREPEGIVDGGGEYEALCDEITRELFRLRNADSAAVVAEVTPVRRAFPGVASARLPDLIVTWASAIADGPISHPQLGAVARGEPTIPTSGHSDRGFLAASGPRILPGATVARAHITDLASTILWMLGAVPPSATRGRVLNELIVPGARLPAAGPRPPRPPSARHTTGA